VEVDLARRELRAHGFPVPIGGRAFEIIEVLFQSAGELVPKSDLSARVWSGAMVEDNTLQFHISAIRRAVCTENLGTALCASLPAKIPLT
jgi:DNA-binding winged helix-turn-helix (wHTH) protein